MIAAFRGGDKKAFDFLFLRHSQKLIDFISHKLNDRSLAADIAQDTWKEVLRLPAGTYHEKGKFFQWLCGIAIHKIKHHYSDEGHYVHPSAERLEEIGGMELPAETGLDKRRLFAVLKMALRKLGCRERAIVVLRFFRGRSFEEIAKRLGITAHSASSMCSKALKLMRPHIAL